MTAGEERTESFHERGSQGGSSQGTLRDAAPGQRAAVGAPAALPQAAGGGAHRAAQLQGSRQGSHGSGWAFDTTPMVMMSHGILRSCIRQVEPGK